MSTLKPTTKISRRQELRQDKVVTLSARIWQAIDENRTLMYGVLGAITVIILGIFGYSYWQQQQEGKAQDLLAPAVMLYESGDYTAALDGTDTTTGLLEIESGFGSTSAGNLARFYAADALFRLGEYDRALELFEEFERDANYLGASALAGEAAIYEVRGEHGRAGDLYRRAALLFPNDVVSPGYLVEAGRAYEASGQYDEAIEVYNMVMDDYPQSVQARDVDLLVARAEAREASGS